MITTVRTPVAMSPRKPVRPVVAVRKNDVSVQPQFGLGGKRYAGLMVSLGAMMISFSMFSAGLLGQGVHKANEDRYCMAERTDPDSRYLCRVNKEAQKDDALLMKIFGPLLPLSMGAMFWLVRPPRHNRQPAPTEISQPVREEPKPRIKDLGSDTPEI